MNLANPAGGTLTWSMTESAAWLALNIASGTTTTETDQVSASVSSQGLAAGTYSTVITVAASGAPPIPPNRSLFLSPSASPRPSQQVPLVSAGRLTQNQI